MGRRNLIPCDSCGCVRCECGINHQIKAHLDTEHWDNRNYDPFAPIFDTREEAEESARFLAAAGGRLAKAA